MTRYLKNMEKEIIIDNQLDEVARIALFIEELGMSLQLPASITMSLNLAIEEAVTNIIRYGYPSNKESEIILRTSVARPTTDTRPGTFPDPAYNGQSRISFHR